MGVDSPRDARSTAMAAYIKCVWTYETERLEIVHAVRIDPISG